MPTSSSTENLDGPNDDTNLNSHTSSHSFVHDNQHYTGHIETLENESHTISVPIAAHDRPSNESSRHVPSQSVSQGWF